MKKLLIISTLLLSGFTGSAQSKRVKTLTKELDSLLKYNCVDSFISPPLNEKRLERIEELEVLLVKAKEEDEEQREKLSQKKAAADRAIKNKQREARLIEMYGYGIADMIMNKKVQPGMTKQMCKESWGRPIDINRTTTANGVTEQWVYSLKSYLYFDGDILTAIQN